MTDTFIQHCETVYRALTERATVKDGQLVFVGKLTDAFKSTGLSMTYYGPVFKTLEDTGAILKIQQGGRNLDSILCLQGIPSEWPEGLGWKGKNSKPLTDESRYGTLLLEVEEIKQSLGGINIVSVLLDFEQRLKALEDAGEESNLGTTENPPNTN